MRILYKNERLGLERQAHMNHIIVNMIKQKMLEDPVIKEKLEKDLKLIHEQFGISYKI